MGAELMLRSVVEQTRLWPGPPELSLPQTGTTGHIPKNQDGAPRYHVKKLLVKRDLNHPRRPLLLARAWDRVPRRITATRSWVRSKDVDLVLDASGFAYGDVWGPSRCLYSTRIYRHFRRQDAPVVLMPQALGPFAKPGMRRAFQELMTHVDLVYARDRVSLEHARTLCDDPQKVRQSPDFTVGLKPMEVDEDARYEGRVAIVPNARMLDKTSSEIRDWYLNILSVLHDHLTKLGMRPFFLLHEAGDRDLLSDIRTGGELEVFWHDDPLRQKGVLGRCRFMVGSRYHALVGALSQGIPCIGLGWSHKYDTLFSEFGSSDLNLPPGAPVQEVLELVERLADDGEYARHAARLEPMAAAFVTKNEAMWAEVRALLLGDG